MRLARVLTQDGVRQAVVAADGISLSPPREQWLPGCDAPGLDAAMQLGADARLLAPVTPSKIVCIGRNYHAHAAELGQSVPSRPLLFHKPSTSIIGPGDAILLPPDSRRVEHEAELAVVIGRAARHVRPEDAGEVVFGVTCLNDVTARDLQRSDGQFARGKGFDTFCPVGPWVETSLDYADLAVRCWVGEQLRQDGRTSAMVFDVATLVAAVTRVMTLRPGDVVATGTPAGVGPLGAGDEVVVEIDGIGRLSNPVLADSEVPGMAPPVSQRWD